MAAGHASDIEARATGKGWVVVGALFLMLGIVITARNSLGLLMPFLKDDLGWSYGLVSSAGAVMLTTMAVVAPLAGMMLDRHGPRLVYALGMSLAAVAFVLSASMSEPWQLVLFYGIVGGAGFAAISPSLVSTTVASHFDRGLGLATGVATSGSTAGQLALMPLLAVLIGAFGWRSSLWIAAAAIVATAIAVHLLIGPREAPGGSVRPASHRGSGLGFRAVLSGLARQRTFWLLAGGFAICGFTTAGVIKIHLIPYAVACGFPPLESATAYGVMSAFSLAGMIAFGHLSDRFHRPALLASIYFMRALTFLVLLQIAGSSTLLFAFAVLFGIFDYATFPIVASLVASHIGRHIMGFTMGLIFAAHSLGGAAGTFLGGYLFELFARYDWVWFVSFGLALIAAALTVLIRENRGGSPAPAPAGA